MAKWYELQGPDSLKDDEKGRLKFAFMAAIMKPPQDITEREVLILREAAQVRDLVSNEGLKVMIAWLEDELERRKIPWEDKRHH